jgi:hypothetical protein
LRPLVLADVGCDDEIEVFRVGACDLKWIKETIVESLVTKCLKKEDLFHLFAN